MVIQPDGKIIAVGAWYMGDAYRFGMVRYHPDGTTDNTFGTNGIVTHLVGSESIGWAAALQPDGKIILAGHANVSGTYNDFDFAIARFTSTGAIDNTFGTNGITTFAGTPTIDVAADVIVQPDGKILFGGTSGNNENFALARFNADGTPDNSFGVNGKLIQDFFGGAEEMAGLQLQADGKIIVAGDVYLNATAAVTDLALLRLHSNGSVDNTFGSAGKVTTVLYGYDEAEGIALSGSKIYVAAYTSSGATYVQAVVSYNNDGTPLPVISASLQARLDDPVVKLFWYTTGNENDRLYEVERSEDATNFLRIGYVQPAVNRPSAHQYQFTDPQPGLQNFYRIKTLLKSGGEQVSNTVVINMKQTGKFTIRPNPATTRLTIQVDGTRSHSAQLTDAGGKILRNIKIMSGMSGCTIDIANLPPGVYLIKSDSRTLPFIKQ